MPTDEHPPAFMLYPRDILFDGKVEMMNTLEFGAYMRLLCRAWFEKPVASIPTDDRELAGWTRLSTEQWTECKAAVLACFKPCSGDRLIQPRLAKEYQKFMASKKKKSEAGKIGARKRWGGNDGDAITVPCECHSDAITPPMRSHSIQPNNPITPNNPVTLNKPKYKTQGGCRGDDAAAREGESSPPSDTQPQGFAHSFSSGSRVAGFSDPHEIPFESMTEQHVFSVFRDLFLSNGIPSAADLGVKVRKCKVTPARWTMLFFDKILYCHEGEGEDSVALTMAGFKRKQSPTDAAGALFREVITDKIGNPDGRGKRYEVLDDECIAEELARRKGREI